MFSYVLFGIDPKFWNGIPYTLLMNSVVYPDFEMKFFVHESSLKALRFEMLKKASERFDSIHLHIIKEPCEQLKLSIWRMKPLWEDNIDYLFCRDMDYAVNFLAKKSVEYFLLQSVCIIHGMRSYKLHTTLLMAGLCGFKVKPVREKISMLAKTFRDYINFGKKNVKYCKNWKWGCDQALLRDFFIRVKMTSSILDCPQYDAPKSVHISDAKYCPVNNYSSMKLPDSVMKILEVSDSFTRYTGNTFMCTYGQVSKIMGFCNNEISEFVKREL